MSENAGTLQYQTDKEQVNKWIDLDTLDSEYAGKLENVSTDDFNLIRFRRGNSGIPTI